MKLKEFPSGDRPRERLLSLGPGALSDAELLALVINTGVPGETALDLARRLLATVGLRNLINSPIEEISGWPGIGPAKAARIQAALELGRRLGNAAQPRPVVGGPKDAADQVMNSMRHLEQENFRILILNTKNQVLASELISVGGLNFASLTPRDVFKGPLRRGAASIILCHNHPSGDPTPSSEDVEITRRIQEAGRLLGIEVLDHIVIGDNCYASLRERGLAFERG